MINGTEYAWEDIQVKLPYSPNPLEGIIGISYKTAKEHKNIYGRGSKPVARGRGRKTFDGSIKILQSTLEAWQAALPVGKDITDVNIPVIPVGYAPEAGLATTDMLQHVRVNEIPKGMEEGDTNMEIELPLTIGNILYNV